MGYMAISYHVFSMNILLAVQNPTPFSIEKWLSHHILQPKTTRRGFIRGSPLPWQCECLKVQWPDRQLPYPVGTCESYCLSPIILQFLPGPCCDDKTTMSKPCLIGCSKVSQSFWASTSSPPLWYEAKQQKTHGIYSVFDVKKIKSIAFLAHEKWNNFLTSDLSRKQWSSDRCFPTCERLQLRTMGGWPSTPRQQKTLVPRLAGCSKRKDGGSQTHQKKHGKHW